MSQVSTDPVVETVRGPVATAELGETLMHEHVFVLTADVQQNSPEDWGSEETFGAEVPDSMVDMFERDITEGIAGAPGSRPRMDRFGINLDTTFEARADIVVEICRRGYAGQMVLSQDAACSIDWVDPGVKALLSQWRYTPMHEDVLAYLREHGVTDEQITAMLVDSPRRYFEDVGTY